MRFPPWSLPRVGNGDSKRKDVAPGHLGDAGSNTRQEGPVNQEVTSRCTGFSRSGSRASNAEEMEKIAPLPSSEGVGGEVGEPRILFPRLGVG